MIKFQSKGMSSVRTNSADEFDVTKAFGTLANEDYERAVQMATGFQGDAPRASATIAIARAVLDTKTTPTKPEKKDAAKPSEKKEDAAKPTPVAMVAATSRGDPLPRPAATPAATSRSGSLPAPSATIA